MTSPLPTRTAERGVPPFFFVTVWRLEAPIARVWEAIHASERYPDWWPNVVSVSVLEAGDASGLGKVERSVWKTELPYRFTFDTRVTRIEKPRVIEVAASGELEGIGRWELAEADGTAVTYTWAVRTNLRWMTLVAPLARPFFVWNHVSVMRKGGLGLAKLLGCRLTSFEVVRNHQERSMEMSSGTERQDLRAKLSPIQYAVTQEASTEPPFSGAYWDHHGDGTYRCVVCGEALFDSGTKFESGTGWPSFYDVVERGHVTSKEDRSLGMRRTEVTCAHCGAHLGHLFPDGPRPTGMRYCINSASLSFTPRDDEARSED